MQGGRSGVESVRNGLEPKLVSVDLYVFMLKHHFRTSCSSVKRKLAVKFSQLHIYPGFNIVVNMCQSPQLQFFL